MQLLARPSQLAPDGEWQTWLVLAGRGFGKTRTGAEWIRNRVEQHGAQRIAFVAATAADARDVMVEGPAGILAISPPTFRPIYEPSKRRLTWPNGATATLFTADKPDRIRGPQHDTAWCDEFCAWRYPQDAWSNLEFGLRLGSNPQVVITTTPRPTPQLRAIMADGGTRVTRGSTYENRANLAASFLKKIVAKYEGTRLGRQELKAELLEDTPGALWTLAVLESAFVRSAPDCDRLVVAIDPQAADPNRTEDDVAETGIIAAGTSDGVGYVHEDASGSYTPDEWGRKAVLLHDRLKADAIVAEANQGGEMVRFVVQTAAEALFREGRRDSPEISVRLVHASRGKQVRAEPVAALYEQHRVKHVGSLSLLESQMRSWIPGEKSPDRMDALVWALTDLMLEHRVPESVGSARAGRRR